MAKSSGTLKGHLSRENEITISVIGRKSGRTISNPVWFVLEKDKLYLLPVYGSETQWYKNVLRNPSIRIGVGGAEAEIRLTPVTDGQQVSSVAEMFRAKYGATNVKKYYSKFDAAAVGEIR